MRNRQIVCLLIICTLLGGCGKQINWDITDESMKIGNSNENEYVNPDNKEDGYCYVEINGIIYLPYGVQNKTITGDMIGECIAYEEDDENQRYYNVIGTDNFIAEYYVNGEMEQVSFLRRMDTIGKDIDIPGFIDDLGYEIWK